jgi:hypothetical protein
MCKQLSQERGVVRMRREGVPSARPRWRQILPPGSRSGASRAVTGSMTMNEKTRPEGDATMIAVSGRQRPGLPFGNGQDDAASRPGQGEGERFWGDCTSRCIPQGVSQRGFLCVLSVDLIEPPDQIQRFWPSSFHKDV